jgi:hypothetical protein
MKLISVVVVLFVINATLLRGGIVQTVGYSVVDANGTVTCRQDETSRDCGTAYPDVFASAGPNTVARLVLSQIDDYTYSGSVWLWNDLRVGSFDPFVDVVAYSQMHVEITEYLTNPFIDGAYVTMTSSSGWEYDSYGYSGVTFPYTEAGDLSFGAPSSIQYGSQIPIVLLWDSTVVGRSLESSIRYQEWGKSFNIRLAAAPSLEPVPEPGTIWQVVLGLGVALAGISVRKLLRGRGSAEDHRAAATSAPPHY